MHKRLAFIDTLRGIAVLCVVLQHALEQIVSSNTTGPYYWGFHDITGYYFNFGRFGVVLFFFVSGFVIPYSFPKSEAPIRDFVVSRFFRLYPAYWLSILTFVILAPMMQVDAVTWSRIGVNLTMLQMFVNVPALRIAYWTLAIELMFYVSCVILFAIGLLNQRLTAFYIVVAVSLIGIIAMPLTGNRAVWAVLEISLNLSSMFFGKVIRDTVINKQLKWQHVVTCAVLYCLFASAVAFKRFGGEYHENFFFSYSIGSSYIGAFMVFMLFAAYGERMASRFMSFVGLISYSVYLMGAYAMVVLMYFFGAGSNPFEWFIFVAAVMSGSILVSWLSYLAVEKPFIAIGRRFRSQSRPAAAFDPSLSGQGAE
jgi:peptidoglycan/LPS O-acetylase OafA/YrhL